MADMADFALPIPDEYAIGLGHVVTAWAMFEFELHKLTCSISGVGVKVGRQLFPRVSDLKKHLGLLSNIARLSKLELPEQFSQLRDKATFDLELRRNWLVHGIWSPPTAKGLEKWGVRITSGDISKLQSRSSPETKELLKDVKSMREKPLIIRFPAEDLTGIAHSIIKLGNLTKNITKQIDVSRRKRSDG